MAKAKIKSEITITAKARYSQLEKLNRSIQRNQSSLKKFQVQLNIVAPLLQKFASKATDALKASLQLGAQFKDLADRSGLGAEQMQVLGNLAEKNGASVDDMSKAVLKLTKSTQDAARVDALCVVVERIRLLLEITLRGVDRDRTIADGDLSGLCATLFHAPNFLKNPLGTKP